MQLQKTKKEKKRKKENSICKGMTKKSPKVLHSVSKSWWEYQWIVCLWGCLVRVCIQTSWFKWPQFSSHTGVSQVPVSLRVLTDWRIAATQRVLNGFIEIFFVVFFFFFFFCTRRYRITAWLNSNTALVAWTVIKAERVHVKTFEHLTCWCVGHPWYHCLLSAKLLHGKDCTLFFLR